MYYDGKLNGTDFFTQSAPFEPVFPQLPQGAPWPEFPGAATMVFSYGPWIGIGCLHSIHEFNIIQEVDYTQSPPQLVSLLTCPVCSYIQRAVYGTCIYGLEVFDPTGMAVIVA
jgi:hypothetical protein